MRTFSDFGVGNLVYASSIAPKGFLNFSEVFNLYASADLGLKAYALGERYGFLETDNDHNVYLTHEGLRKIRETNVKETSLVEFERFNKRFFGYTRQKNFGFGDLGIILFAGITGGFEYLIQTGIVLGICDKESP